MVSLPATKTGLRVSEKQLIIDTSSRFACNPPVHREPHIRNRPAKRQISLWKKGSKMKQEQKYWNFVSWRIFMRAHYLDHTSKYHFSTNTPRYGNNVTRCTYMAIPFCITVLFSRRIDHDSNNFRSDRCFEHRRLFVSR